MVDVTLDKVKTWFGITEEAIASKVAEEEAGLKDAADAKVADLEAQLEAAKAEAAALAPVAPVEPVADGAQPTE